MSIKTVAVVGAGMSGLSCALRLADRGYAVSIFEKARGPGGRMSTRRAGSWRFDHGAQYFTVRDPLFRDQIASWRKAGLVARWKGSIVVLGRGQRPPSDCTERFVAVPAMSSLCRNLAESLQVSYGTRVSALHRIRNRWQIWGEGGADLGEFDILVVSAPAPQTAELLAAVAPDMAEHATQAEMAPCWAVMVAFDSLLDLDFDGAFVNGSPLSWVARNVSKPGRPAEETWVLHGSPQWSQENLARDKDEVKEALLEAFFQAVDRRQIAPAHLDAHRWRYALPLEPLPEPVLFHGNLSLAACGDWCGGPRVEGAFLSGISAAERILAQSPGPGQTQALHEDP